MNENDLYAKVSELEGQIRQLQKELQRCLDHPKTELLPHLPMVVTSPNRLVLSVSGQTLTVKQKDQTLGSITLVKG